YDSSFDRFTGCISEPSAQRNARIFDLPSFGHLLQMGTTSCFFLSLLYGILLKSDSVARDEYFTFGSLHPCLSGNISASIYICDYHDQPGRSPRRLEKYAVCGDDLLSGRRSGNMDLLGYFGKMVSPADLRHHSSDVCPPSAANRYPDP